MKQKLHDLLYECVNKIEATNPNKYSRFGRYVYGGDLEHYIKLIKEQKFNMLSDIGVVRIIHAADSI